VAESRELRIIRSLTFQPDGSVAVEYVEPSHDLKSNGVQLQHVCFVPIGSDYNDEIGVVEEACRLLLDDVLEDMPNLGPPSPLRGAVAEPDDEDEELDDRCPACRKDNHKDCIGCSCECPGYAR
jgi:hypothetical protein